MPLQGHVRPCAGRGVFSVAVIQRRDELPQRATSCWRAPTFFFPLSSPLCKCWRKTVLAADMPCGLWHKLINCCPAAARVS